MTPPPKKSAAKTGPTPVDAFTHDDTRVNIPTGELRDFVADDEDRPGTITYERNRLDPALDPQLVWIGKAQQDDEGLSVPNVPVYIQEKIDPRVIIENLRQTAAAGGPEPELTLFDDFDGIGDFDRVVEFYRHPQNWSNRLILGDSLVVMNSLAERERLKGQVQMIYLDPPYGIKFGSNWQVSTRKRDVSDGKVTDATRQPEQIKAFRDTWELGIHSYLTYLRDRLVVARELLSESGSIFVQIGDENVHLVRSLMDEVFGSENFVSLITFRKTSGATSDFLAGTTDFIVWYGRDRTVTKFRPLYKDKALGGPGGGAYTSIQLANGERRRMTLAERSSGGASEDARVFRLDNLTSQSAGREKGEGAASWFPVDLDGNQYLPSVQSRWKTNEVGMARLKAAGRLSVAGKTLSYVRFLNDFPAFPISDSWEDTGIAGFGDPKVYVVQTNVKVAQRCMLMTTDPGDLVLDPTCGSGTTAVVAEQWGRRWITIDTSRVAVALARTRLMAAKHPYYKLADPDGRDVRQGFEYRTVPHITLKSIAQNPDIREGMTRDEIDAAIARHADHETLYDQPFEDRKRVRVTGPFTVESVSPHRMASDEEERPAATDVAPTGASFASTILANLVKAGVQNTVRGEHLAFDALEPFPGQWIHARGEFTDADGTTRTVGVSLGPEYGTVDAEHVREAAKEALRGAGVDLLLVCGFAFDPDAGEKAVEFRPDEQTGWAAAAEERRMGRLPLLLVKMNPDLAMGEDLLKKTGAGNLFMVFGDPDVDIRRTDDGQVEVEIRGVDVYDPTRGEVRSSSVDDIACWMIDTDYNGESFFVRHAYFLGAGDPYKSLQRALRADIDEDAWASLYRETSRPFPAPSTGRIAVKVINHYGDEVLKVYPAG